MEHNIHVALTAAAILGLLVYLEERRLPWWFVASVALLPLDPLRGAGAQPADRGVPRLARFVEDRDRRHSLHFRRAGHLLRLPGQPRTALPAGLNSCEIPGDGFGCQRDGGMLASIIEMTQVNISTAAGFLLALFAVSDWRCCGPTSVAGPCATRRSLHWSCSAYGGPGVAGQFGWWGRYEVYAFVGATMMGLYLLRTAVAGELVDAGQARAAGRRRRGAARWSWAYPICARSR